MSTKNPKVEAFFDDDAIWHDEFLALRDVLRETELTEEFKWRAPCYTVDGKNVVILGRFKAGVALSFFKGVLLKDESKVLISPGENSNEGRLLRFNSVDEVLEAKDLIKAYVAEAIKLEKDGVKLPEKEAYEVVYSEEMLAKFDETDGLQDAFENLTPGRQKGYMLYFEGTKNSATKTARIERYIPRILNGKGMRDCVCGHSGKYPTCDGTHKDYPEDYY
jgi:uncharacterized protein YdeI (YjbR/CyaY-like superfamily)